MSHLINIFLEPSKVFAELKEKPTFIVPLILVSLAMSVMFLMYFSKVDSSWFIDYAISASGNEMSAAEIAQMRSVMPGAKIMGYIYAIGAPFMFAVVALITALYYLIAGKVTGSAVSFKQGLSLASWSSMPMLLSTIVAVVGVSMMSPQTSLESLMLTNIDPLIFQLPLDNQWSKLAKGFNLLNFWCIFLVATGWKVWGKTSWGEAITVAIIPSVVIYGAMALWALI